MKAVVAGAAMALLASGACGDKSSATGAAPSSSSAVASTGVGGSPMPPPQSCPRPGDQGNELGVGHYCTPHGNECDPFPDAPLCLADVGQDQWMCTRIMCDAKTNCGKGAGCLFAGGGSACVPCKCSSQGIGCLGGGGGGAGGRAGS